MTQYYLGIMSGTSLDGVDLALMDFNAQPTLIAAGFTPMPAEIRQKITALIQTGHSSLQMLGELDHQLGQLYAQCVNRFLSEKELSPEQIVAIGCHGQTIWHAPRGAFPFTMQIGDMNIVAANTGITTVGDFRRKDMALGGQGAPLVPAFHQAMFFNPSYTTVVLNIGGISNISVLAPNQSVIGFDTGPGNTLLDQWFEQHLGKPYDCNGEWAAGGKVNQRLLTHLLDDPFFQLPPPKSTGRELFNSAWLAQKLAETEAKSTALCPRDVQATLVEFTVQSQKRALQSLGGKWPCRLLLCGGGAKNPLFGDRLRLLLPDWQIATTTEFGLDVDFVEAAAFAWLAYRRINRLPSNLPSVTGAQSAVSLGAIFTA